MNHIFFISGITRPWQCYLSPTHMSECSPPLAGLAEDPAKPLGDATQSLSMNFSMIRQGKLLHMNSGYPLAHPWQERRLPCPPWFFAGAFKQGPGGWSWELEKNWAWRSKKKQPAEGPNNLLEGPHVVISIVSGSMVAQGWLVWSWLAFHCQVFRNWFANPIHDSKIIRWFTKKLNFWIAFRISRFEATLPKTTKDCSNCDVDLQRGWIRIPQLKTHFVRNTLKNQVFNPFWGTTSQWSINQNE